MDTEYTKRKSRSMREELTRETVGEKRKKMSNEIGDRETSRKRERGRKSDVPP